MNILIFEEADLDGSSLTIRGRRHEHIRKVLKLTSGDTIRVGQLNSKLGLAEVKEVGDMQSVLSLIALDQSPPPTLQLTLALALPRPQMLKRCLQTCATLGVKRIILFQSSKVEKNYWQSPSAQPGAMRDNLILGLEQAGATQLPELTTVNKAHDFMNKVLPERVSQSQVYVAHPGILQHAPDSTAADHTLVIGPEGGFTKEEVERLGAAHCRFLSLGERILRVETAVPVGIARFMF